MTTAQRIRYATEARQAYEAEEATRFESGVLKFDDWRHAEIAYVLGRPGRFKDFSQLDLTRMLIHFRALQAGERLTPAAIAAAALDRNAHQRLEPLRAVWDAIATQPRATAMWARFKIMFFEELAGLNDREFGIARVMLQRLAADNPGKNSGARIQEPEERSGEHAD